MKKLPTLFTLLMLLLVGTTYLYYTHWRSQEQRAAAVPYIPASAALAYEVTDFHQQWEQLQQTSIGQILGTLPPFTALHQAVHWLKKELRIDSSRLDEVPLMLSLHPSSKGPPECLLYFNLYDVPTQAFWAAIMDKVEKDPTCHTATKKHAGHQIISWHKEGAKQQVAYFQHKQYIIASFSPVLLEEAAQALVRNHTTSLVRLHKSENIHGSLYVNYQQLAQCVQALVRPQEVSFLSSTLATLAQDSRLNLQRTPRHLLFQGAANVSKPKCLLHTLAGQTPGPLALTAYLPQRTAVLQHVTFNHPDQLLEAWQRYGGASSALPKDTDDLLEATLLASLKDELAHCTLRSKPGQKAGQLVFLKVADPQALISVLEGAQTLTSTSTKQVYRITSDCFQHSLPGLLFPAFKASFLTHVDDYVLLADHQDTLQTWRVQYQQGKTWDRLPAQKAWLASTLDQAHLTWMVDVQQVWPALVHALQPQWQQALQNHVPPPLDISLQLLDNTAQGCYMSLLLKSRADSQFRGRQVQPISRPLTATAKTPPGKALFKAAAPLAHAPWIVKSHRGQGHYVLLQDIRHQLYLLDPAGKLLWKKALEGPITTHISEVDFYKNKKTQYLFATAKKLHLLDYYGRDMSPYPQLLPAPSQLQVIDYSRDKNYRFLLATAGGAVYLKDKHYRSLPGWKPRKLGHAFSEAPFHARLQGRDRFFALQTNGSLQMLNRRGRSYAGFPVSLKVPTHNPLIVRKTAAGNLLTVVTDKGQQVDLSLAGQIKKKMQFKRTASTQRFVVCPNQAPGDSYAIMRQDAKKVVIMDAAGKSIFEVPYTKEQPLVQYYSFEKGKQFYALTSPEKQMTTMYDGTGRQLTTIPSLQGHEVRLVWSAAKRRLLIYSSSGKECTRYVWAD